MKVFAPLLFLLVGAGLGAGAGIFLSPKSSETTCEGDACPQPPVNTVGESKDTSADTGGEPDYVRMQNQFVVPVVRAEKIQSLVVMSLSLEVEQGVSDLVYQREPKLRDTFLRVLFDHAHIGGFDGQFTQSGQLSVLRVALLEAAQSVIGTEVSDILITDIIRQEM